MTDKNNLRRQMINLLRQSPRPDLNSFDFKENLLLAYIPLKSEVNVIPLVDKAMEEGKTVAVPTADPKFFAVLQYNWKDNLVTFPDKSKGVFSDELIDIETVDEALVLVPGLAFTEKGDRLGRGSGFYDRVLRHLKPSVRTVGVCRKCQIVIELPLEPHDKRVQSIIST